MQAPHNAPAHEHPECDEHPDRDAHGEQPEAADGPAEEALCAEVGEYEVRLASAVGPRRPELFGCPHNVRPGWGPLGTQLRSVETLATKYDRERYLGWMREPGVNPDGTPCAGHLLGSTPLFEELRPKAPPGEAPVATAAAIGASGG